MDAEKIIVDEYHKFTFLDFKDGWVKVGYYKDGTYKLAWMSPDDQCHLPWTECGNYDD